MEITIVIPTYNREAYLTRTLSTIPVSYPLIVVDNASTDGTLALAEHLCRERNAQPGAAPAMVISETTPGAASARNCGLAACKTEWIYFFDSDDEFTGLPVPEAHAAYREHQEYYDMICFPVTMVIDGKPRVRHYRPVDDPAVHLITSMLGTQSMLFRTAWLRSIGGWDDHCRIWDDWELGVRALLRHPRLLWLTDQAYHRILVHPDSLTGDSFSSRWPLIRDTLQTVLMDIILQSEHSSKLRRRMVTAYNYRCHIIAGMLRHEGSIEAANAIRGLAISSFTCRALEHYTAHGGRGAWRIALNLL